MKYSKFLKLKAEVDRMTVDREQKRFPAASVMWYDWQHRIQMAKQGSSLPSLRTYWSWILERVSSSECIADFGCGGGGFAKFAIEDGKTFVLGTDFSETAIEQAKQLNPEYAHCFRCEDLNSVCGRSTLEHAVYDTAVLTEVLEHVEDDLAILRAVPLERRVLLSVPSFSARGHCRWFATLEDAEKHYVKFLRIVYSEALSPRRSGQWWMIDGVRR